MDNAGRGRGWEGHVGEGVGVEGEEVGVRRWTGGGAG